MAMALVDAMSFMALFAARAPTALAFTSNEIDEENPVADPRLTTVRNKMIHTFTCLRALNTDSPEFKVAAQFTLEITVTGQLAQSEKSPSPVTTAHQTLASTSHTEVNNTGTSSESSIQIESTYEPSRLKARLA
ncbi:MAG TPA: hypothetical protein VFU16_00790 [Solirubrobacterales bacterium]|nr:hypothetical protein [Solirubrobacterales bacterium]